MRLLLAVLLSVPAAAQLQDVGFDDFTPTEDSDLIVVREAAYGAGGVDLSAWGISGVHDYVQSIYVRARQSPASKHALRGRLIFPPGITILGVITEQADLGGSTDDGILTETDAVFAIAAPDLYSAHNRGLTVIPSEHACIRANGTVDYSFTFALNSNDLDDFRVIIDYGSSFPANMSFDVETFFHSGVEMEPGEPGIRVGGGGVLGSQDWGEVRGLDGIPLTSAVLPSPNGGLAYDMTSGILILRADGMDMYDPSEQFLGKALMRASDDDLVRGPYGYVYSKQLNLEGYAFTDIESGARAQIKVAGVGSPVTIAAHENSREIVLARHKTPSIIDVSLVDVDTGELIVTYSTVQGDMASLKTSHIAAGKIFLLSGAADFLVMDPATGSYTRMVLTSVTGSYQNIESNAAETELYLLRSAAFGGGTVIDVYDIASGVVTYSALQVTNPKEPRGITRDANGLLWISNRGFATNSLSLAAFDPTTWTMVESFEALCGAGYPSADARADITPNSLGSHFCSPVVPNSRGYPGAIAAFGTLEAARNDLHLLAHDLPNGQFGYFINSPTTGFIPTPGTSDGNLCVIGQVGRHNGQVAAAVSGSIRIEVDLDNLPRPIGSTAVMSGETWHFQCWYRDVQVTNNFTDGISLTFL